ncbi:N-acetyltransferase [Streptomyces dysideae]|uniref:N-acetyltransferase domain-containing protein n=1 Tax=Streptomyces dysideae TaxID=909626 RepID=A0A101V3D2_9ACTN|nr:hypothetical protein [Streptomyces dysideae]KUO21733.1 hypothetical protein AQJ91_08155 [Streptomyces dysideae]
MKLTDRSAATRTSRTQPTSMDLALDRDGNCVGTMEMGSDGGSVEIVKRGEEVWMKPDTAFWKAQVPGGEGDEVAELFKNRYIHGHGHSEAGRCDAAARDFTVVRLETHATLTEAQAMYRACGYTEIPRHDDNVHAAHWFGKRLPDSTAAGRSRR